MSLLTVTSKRGVGGKEEGFPLHEWNRNLVRLTMRETVKLPKLLVNETVTVAV